MINIAIINAHAEMGGPDVALLTMLKSFKSENFKITTVFPSESYITREIERLGFTVILLKTAPLTRNIAGAAFFSYAYNFFVSVFQFRKFYKKYKINIIHNNSSALVTSTIATFFLRIKIVYHIREVWSNRNLLAKLLYKFIRRTSDHIICITQTSFYKNFTSHEERIPSNVSIINDAVDLGLYENANFQKADGIKDPLIITCIGRLTPIKGQDIFIKAAASILSSSPGIKLNFRIIGDIPASNNYYIKYRDELKSMVSQNNMEKDILFYGFRNDVPSLLQQSNILVLPSRIEEGLGLVMLEGWAAKNLVITSNLGGQKEIIESAEAGLTFENENAADLAKKIALYWTDSDIVMPLIERGHKNVFTNFDNRKYYKKIETIYKKIIA